MQRDVNLNLIYVILVLLIALGGTAVFYQMKYEKLKADYQNSINAFNDTIENFSYNQKYLYENLGELNVSADREYVLSSRLEKKTRDLENTSIELAYARQGLFECQQTADLLNVNYTISKEMLDRHTASTGIMQDKLDGLKSDVNSGALKEVLLADIQHLQDELNKLKSY